MSKKDKISNYEILCIDSYYTMHDQQFRFEYRFEALKRFIRLRGKTTVSRKHRDL